MRAAAECLWGGRRRRYPAPLEPKLSSHMNWPDGAAHSSHKTCWNAPAANCTSCQPSLSDEPLTQPPSIPPLRRRWLSRLADRLSSPSSYLRGQRSKPLSSVGKPGQTAPQHGACRRCKDRDRAPFDGEVDIRSSIAGVCARPRCVPPPTTKSLRRHCALQTRWFIMQELTSRECDEDGSDGSSPPQT